MMAIENIILAPISGCLTAWAKDSGIYFAFCGSKIQSSWGIFLTKNGR